MRKKSVAEANEEESTKDAENIKEGNIVLPTKVEETMESETIVSNPLQKEANVQAIDTRHESEAAPSDKSAQPILPVDVPKSEATKPTIEKKTATTKNEKEASANKKAKKTNKESKSGERKVDVLGETNLCFSSKRCM